MSNQRTPVTFDRCIKCGKIIDKGIDKYIEFDEDYPGQYICNPCFDKSNTYVECQVETCNGIKTHGNIFNIKETNYTNKNYEDPYITVPCLNCEGDI